MSLCSTVNWKVVVTEGKMADAPHISRYREIKKKTNQECLSFVLSKRLSQLDRSICILDIHSRSIGCLPLDKSIIN
jgi:hypothetical protein